MEIYVIRHGETNWNIQKKLQGRADIPLNDKGRELAELTGQALSAVPFDICFTSPLTRTLQTAEAVLGYNEGYGSRAEEMLARLKAEGCIEEAAIAKLGDGIPVVKADELIEVSFGSWEGLSTAADNMEIPVDNFSQFFDDPELVELPEDAETTEAVKQRTAAFLKRLAGMEALKDKKVLLTTHGFSMRALLNPLYEDSSDFWQEHVPYNCETAIIEADHGEMRLLDRGRIYYDVSLASTYK